MRISFRQIKPAVTRETGHNCIGKAEYRRIGSRADIFHSHTPRLINKRKMFAFALFYNLYGTENVLYFTRLAKIYKKRDNNKSLFSNADIDQVY